MALSEGEYSVATPFNPGAHPEVDEVKKMAAAMIDYIWLHGKDGRCSAVALHEIESGAMWAVKSITKRPRGQPV